MNQGVVIRGDASLAYQDLADVLAACDVAGIRNVRLPVRSRERQPTGAVTAHLRVNTIITDLNATNGALNAPSFGTYPLYHRPGNS